MLSKIQYTWNFSNPNGVHWDAKVRRYGIVGDNLIQCFQGIILTLGTTTFVANVAFEAFIVMQDSLAFFET
jgi:hypothetical protein